MPLPPPPAPVPFVPAILIARRRRCLCRVDIAAPQDAAQWQRVIDRWQEHTDLLLVEEITRMEACALTRADFGCPHIGLREPRTKKEQRQAKSAVPSQSKED